MDARQEAEAIITERLERRQLRSSGMPVMGTLSDEELRRRGARPRIQGEGERKTRSQEGRSKREAGSSSSVTSGRRSEQAASATGQLMGFSAPSDAMRMVHGMLSPPMTLNKPVSMGQRLDPRASIKGRRQEQVIATETLKQSSSQRPASSKIHSFKEWKLEQRARETEET